MNVGEDERKREKEEKKREERRRIGKRKEVMGK